MQNHKNGDTPISMGNNTIHKRTGIRHFQNYQENGTRVTS